VSEPDLARCVVHPQGFAGASVPISSPCCEHGRVSSRPPLSAPEGTTTPTPTFAELERLGLAAGLDAFGVTDADPFVHTRAVLEERKAAGLAGSMQFTYRNPARATDPSVTVAQARTLLVGAAGYQREPPVPPTDAGPLGRAARYVWADDQERLLGALGAVADALKAGGSRAVVVSDQNHLVDRAAAHRAGLGWFGKSSNLLLPGHGSWFLLGAVVTDAEVPGRPGPSEVADGCGTCERCITACPTGAIVAPGVVDARRCLSWSLQTTGPFPREHRVAVADRLYGCDDCQDVCPPNRVELRRSAPGGRGAAVPEADPDKAWIPLLELLAATDEELLARHGRWYIPRRDARYLRRNALVVLGNVADPGDPAVRRALRAALEHPDGLVRAHAVWSSRRLGCDDLAMAARDDPDPEVQAEFDAPAPPRRRPAVPS
jgi:epoxyqueuosine reductase